MKCPKCESNKIYYEDIDDKKYTAICYGCNHKWIVTNDNPMG